MISNFKKMFNQWKLLFKNFDKFMKKEISLEEYKLNIELIKIGLDPEREDEKQFYE